MFQLRVNVINILMFSYSLILRKQKPPATEIFEFFSGFLGKLPRKDAGTVRGKEFKSA
jgi:hypothetical protein